VELQKLTDKTLEILRGRMTELSRYGFNLLNFEESEDTLGRFGGELGFRKQDFMNMLEFTGFDTATAKNLTRKLGCIVVTVTSIVTQDEERNGYTKCC
jgi:hypothetical protein